MKYAKPLLAAPAVLEREAAGRYLVRDTAGRRLGYILGRAGDWLAERADGKPLSRFNTRSDAANALLNCSPVRFSHTARVPAK
jgi:hypothetical protein